MSYHSNIQENWIFKFYDQNGANLFLAFQDYVDSSNNFYHGVITNNPSIRESIDLKKSKAKASNINLTIPNFQYKGVDFSEELFGGTSNYINRAVEVYSVINRSITQIATFRLSDFSLSDDTITISLIVHKPWDLIEFPQTQHPDYPIYEPVVYGDFTPASSANASGNDVVSAYGTVYPVPVLHISSDSIYTLMPRSYTTSDNAGLHKYFGFNQFLPLRLSPTIFSNEGLRIDSITSTTIDNSGLNVLKARTHEYDSNTLNLCTFDGYMTTAPSNKSITSIPMFSNQENMFKRTVTGALDDTKTTTAVFDSEESFNMLFTSPKKEMYFDSVTKLLYRIKLSDVTNPQSFNHQVWSNRFSSLDDNLIGGDGRTRAYFDTAFNSGTGTYSTDTGAITFNDSPQNSTGSNEIVAGDEILGRISSISSGLRENNTLSIASCQLYFKQQVPHPDGDATPSELELSAQQDYETLQKTKTFYCGGNGLKASWSGTPNITEIHEAHRDLLIRFAGLGTSDPQNWSNLNSEKDWKIRYWQLNPVELKRELERLQYEGGFIFRYKKGKETEPQYIYISDTYNDGDITYSKTISKNDLSDINVTPDSYDSLNTQMDIEYQKHPAERNYIIKTSAKNSTIRTKYNIDTKENIAPVKLDAYVLPEIPTSPSSNPNDDFYSYYDNISGDIKLNISASIVNPKFFNIDIGETIEFTDMHPEKAFGKAYTDVVFMVTSVSRSLGKVKFKAREIQTIS